MKRWLTKHILCSIVLLIKILMSMDGTSGSCWDLTSTVRTKMLQCLRWALRRGSSAELEYEQEGQGAGLEAGRWHASQLEILFWSGHIHLK